MVGTAIGQYKVGERLGEGGMGVVYKARDTKLERTVAIKVLPPELVADTGRNARFAQEAKAASALNHPNIVIIHDIVSHPSGECLVMEYIEGKSLSLLIAEREIGLAEILRIAAQTADAIAAAHAAGIIHRDLKPANIMVTPGGLVKVLDFGLAKLVSGSGASPGVTVTMPRTDPGTVVGTPGYMSPEQVRGLDVDRRTDIFNLGLVLYEMLAGTRAFRGETAADVASAILKESPPDLPETVPAALRQLVAVCLEKNPINRFESARDIGYALRALSAGTSLTGAISEVKADRAGGHLRRIALPLGMVVMALTAVILAGLYFLKGPGPLDLSSYRYTPFAVEPMREFLGSWSPDGKSIAYFRDVGRKFQLFTRALNATSPTRLTGEEAGIFSSYPFWSAQGDRIYYVSNGNLWSVGVAGGETELVISDVHYAAALSPDGKVLVFWKKGRPEDGTLDSLWISSPPGAAPRKYEPSPFAYEGGDLPVYIRFSPDGKRIGLSEMKRRTLWILDWPDGPGAKARRPFPEGAFGSEAPGFDWFRDSEHVVLVNGGLWQGDVRTGRLLRMTNTEGPDTQTGPSVSPDGRRIVYASLGLDFDITEIPLDGSRPVPFLATSVREYSPSLTGSGDRMAYITEKSGRSEIWLRSTREDWERPVVTPDDFGDGMSTLFFTASLSPDGSRIVYSRRNPSGNRIWISPASGGTPMQSVEGIAPSWAPDGNSFTCRSATGGIAIVRTGSAKAVLEINDPASKTPPIWSPDGRWIAFGTTAPADRLILVSPDGKTKRSIPCPVRPWYDNFVMAWSQDSSRIFAASSQTETAELFSVEIQTGKSTKIADLGKELSLRGHYNYYMSATMVPGGNSFLTTTRNQKTDLWILEGFPQPKR